MVGALVLLAGCSAASTDEAVEAAVETEEAAVRLCADAADAAQVQEFYRDKRPGAATPIPGRALGLPESRVVSGLAEGQAVGTPASRAAFETVWASMDAWGSDTPVGFVLSIDGWHPFNYPTRMPITQPNPREAFYDIYVDEGDGPHIHINPDELSLIYAVELPSADGESATRAVNFYDPDGGLVFGIYGTEAGDPANEAAVSGFQGTWSAIESMNRACVS